MAAGSCRCWTRRAGLAGAGLEFSLHVLAHKLGRAVGAMGRALRAVCGRLSAFVRRSRACWRDFGGRAAGNPLAWPRSAGDNAGGGGGTGEIGLPDGFVDNLESGELPAVNSIRSSHQRGDERIGGILFIHPTRLSRV